MTEPPRIDLYSDSGGSAPYSPRFARAHPRVTVLLRRHRACRVDDVLFPRYWVEGQNVSEHDVLLDAAEEAGLDRSATLDALADPYWIEVVRGETVQAQAMGAGGVPAWVIDQRVLVPGAQPHELFERILGKLGHEAAA